MRLTSYRHRLRSIAFIAMLAIVVLVPLALYISRTPRQAAAAWYDDSYGYRHRSVVDHNAAISEPRAVTFTLDTAELITAGIMQSDCDDTRFTDANGLTLYYDLTGTCNNASTTYEVIFPSIASGINVFYVYYGNATATNGEINSASYTTLTPNGGDPSLTNPTTSGNQEKSASPISHWSFDEASGTTANDSSSYQNDATLTSATSAITEVEQQINIIDQEYTTTSTTDAPTDNSLGLILWDGSKYTGETVYFEAIIKCTTCSGGNTAAMATLYTDAGGAVTGGSVSTTSSSYTLVRSAAITGNLTNSEEYTIRLKVDATSGTAAVKAARLIVLQSDATAITDTQNQIEIGNAQTISGTSYDELTDPKYYYYDSTKNSSVTNAYFEATLKGDTGSSAQGDGRIFSSGFELNSTSGSTGCIEWCAAATHTGTIQTSTVRSGTYALQIDSLVSGARKNFIDWHGGTTPFYYRVYLRIATLPSAENRIISVNNSTSAGTSVRAYLTIDNTGALRLYDEDGSIGSASSALSTDTWYRIEFLFDSSGVGATDVVRARIDGTEFAASTTRDLSSSVLALHVGGNLASEAQTTGNWFFDDVAINDSTGGYPGPGKIIHLRPNATGDDPSPNPTCTNDYTTMDEVTPNDATDYIVCNSLNETLDVNLDNTPGEMASNDVINNVAVGVRARSNDGSANARYKLRIKASPGGTTQESTQITNNSSTWTTNAQANGDYWFTLYDLPGASTTSWTKSDLDAAQVGTVVTVSNGSTEAQVSALWMLVDYTPAEELNVSARAKLQQCDESSCSWSDVSGGTATTPNTTFTRSRSSAITLTNNRRYRVVVSKSDSSGTVKIANAKIIIDQSDSGGLGHIELIHQHANTLATDTDSSYTSQSFLNEYDPANFAVVPDTYYEATIKTSAGTGYAQAYNNTATTALSGSEISTASTSYTRVRSGSLTMPVSAADLDTQIKNSATNTTSIASSWLILQIEGATSGTFPTWQSEATCVKGSCLNFNGDLVSQPYTSDVPLAPGTGSFSVTTWFKHSSTLSGTDTLISRFNSGGYKLYTSASGLCFGIDNDGTSFPSDSACTTNTYADSSWHFLVAVKNGTSSISLYIDGIRVGQDSSITSSSISGSNPDLYIGAESTGGTNSWAGYLDEVKIYNYALSETQIKANAAGIQSSHGVAASFQSPQQSLASGLVGYWKLDETSGNATDSSGNYNTLTNNGTTTFVTGKFGYGSEHAPASSQYLSNPSTISGVKAIAFWVNPDSTTNYFTSLTSSVNLTATSGTLVTAGITAPRIYVNGLASTSITADTWQHVVVVFDTGITADQLYLGRVSSNYFDGTLDDFRLYNRTITPAEITSLYNSPPGPVAYWKMGENSGTEAQDASGNGYTASLTDMTDSSWNTGKFGAALLFNGTSNYANVANENADFSYNAYSYSLWINRRTDSGAAEIILDNRDAADDGHLVQISSTDKAECYFNATASISTSSINTDTWYHLECTSDGSTQTLYLNGVKEDSDSLSGTIAENTDLHLGTRSFTPHISYFPGIIDDVKVYNYTRSSKQVTEDLNGGHPIGGSPIASQAEYWAFDEQHSQTVQSRGFTATSGTLGTDSSASSDDPAWKTAADCKLNGCLDFDGSSDYVDMDDIYDLNHTDARTFSMWVYPDSNSNTQYFMSKQDSNSPFTGWQVGIANAPGKLVFEYIVSWSTDALQVESNTAVIQANVWQHIALTYDNEIVKMYYNGKEIPTTYNVNTLSSSTNNSISFNIGARNDGAAAWFNGKIDEAKIYNGALTPEEIRLDMNAGLTSAMGGVLSTNNSEGFGGNPPVAQWNLDENTGTAVNDTSGNNLAGTLTNSPTWVQGKVGSALQFTGTSFVSIADNDALSPANNTFTLEAWVRPTALSGTHTVVAKDTDAASGREYLLEVNAAGNVVFGASTTSSDLDSITSNDIVRVNQWSHIVGRLNGSNIETYINGAFDKSEAWSGATVANTSTAVNIGRRDTASTKNQFEGIIDQVRLYTYARTPAQIAYDYNRGAPIGWYKFDECQGSAVYSSGLNSNGQPNGFNGTINAGDATGNNDSAGSCNSGASGSTNEMWNAGSTGKFNSALSFDGTNDYVNLGNLYQFTSSFSVSAWTKLDDPQNNEGNDYLVNKMGGPGARDWVLWNDLGQFVFQVSPDGTNVTGAYSIEIAEPITWYHVVGVYDASAPSLVLYIDGKLNSVGTSDTVPTSINATSNDVRIGSRQSTSSYAKGLIDEVMVFNYPLSADQVKTLYNGRFSGRFGPATGSP